MGYFDKLFLFAYKIHGKKILTKTARQILMRLERKQSLKILNRFDKYSRRHELYMGEFTQNNNESYNELLWKISSKLISSGLIK